MTGVSGGHKCTTNMSVRDCCVNHIDINARDRRDFAKEVIDPFFIGWI